MEKIGLMFRIDSKTYYEIIPADSNISFLYDIFEMKTNRSIKKTHCIKIYGKIVDDNSKLQDYNVNHDSTIEAYFSVGKAEKYRDPDNEGEIMFSQLIKDIEYGSGLNDVNIISLMSYNVDISNPTKMILQQLQYPTLKKVLKKLVTIKSKLEGLININIILTDRNFISYNKQFNQNNIFDILLEENNFTPQIDTLLNIKPNTGFMKNAHKYNYRVSKYSIMLQNFKLVNILNVPKSLQKIIQLNFYYVGIIFENIYEHNINNHIIYGFNFSPLKESNLHVVQWTGDKLL